MSLKHSWTVTETGKLDKAEWDSKRDEDDLGVLHIKQAKQVLGFKENNLASSKFLYKTFYR